MTQSAITLKALSKAIKTHINHVSTISTEKGDMLLCLGEHCMYLLDDEFGLFEWKEIKNPIPYAVIREVHFDRFKSLIQIKIGSPEHFFNQSITINAPKPQNILDYLKCAWLTDHMFRTGNYLSFPLIEKKGINKGGIKTGARIPSSSTKEPHGCRPHYLKGYCYHLDLDFKLVEQSEGAFIHKENGAKFQMEISDQVPVDIIPTLKAREDMRSFTQKSVQSLLNENEDYWEILNMVGDVASWQCWEIHYITEHRDLFAILARRKYIPPLMDSFADILCTFEGSNEHTHHNRAHIRKVIDSIHSTKQTTHIYKPLIQEKVEALLFDEDQAQFFQNSLNIVPQQGMIYAVVFVKSILTVLRKFEQECNELLKMLNATIKKERINVGMIPREVAKDPFEIIRCFENSNMLGTKETPELLHWRVKVAAYLAFAVNGGLLYGNFTLKKFITYVNKIPTPQEQENMEGILNYLLHLRSKGGAFDQELMVQVLKRMMTSPNYLYNSTVMQALIETNYVHQKLSGESPVLSPRFIFFLFGESTNAKIKASVCRQIIRANADLTYADLDEQVQTAYVQIVEPLGKLISSSCLITARLATMALSNLALNLQVIKSAITCLIPNIMKNLNCRDHELLQYTLHLILSLITSWTIAKTFLTEHDLIRRILDLLHGTGIKRIFHTKQTVEFCLQIIINITKWKEPLGKDKFRAVPESKSTILHLYAPDEHFEPNIEIQEKIYLLLKILMFKDDQKKEEIGQVVFPFLRVIFEEYLEKKHLSMGALEICFKLIKDLVDNCPQNSGRLANMTDLLNDFSHLFATYNEDLHRKVGQLLAVVANARLSLDSLE